MEPGLLNQVNQIQKSIDSTENERSIVRIAKKFESWCVQRGSSQPFPIQADLLIAFLVFRCNALHGSAKSLMTWVRQLETYSLIHRFRWLDSSDSRTVLKIIRSLEAADLAPTKRMEPLLHELVVAISNDPSVPFISKLACSVGHDGLLRGGEICSGLTVSDHIWSPSRNSVTIRLHRTKVHRRGGPQYVTLRDYGPFSAVRMLRRHFDRHSLWSNPKSFVYPCFSRGKYDWNHSLATWQLRSLIKAAVQGIGLDPSRYACHSLRAGGATDLFRCGVYYPTIKKFGRWKSDTALIYYRDDEGVSEAVSQGFSKLSRNFSKVIPRPGPRSKPILRGGGEYL